MSNYCCTGNPCHKFSAGYEMILASCIALLCASGVADDPQATKPLTAEAVRLLITREDRVKILASELSEEAAEVLAAYKGRIVLVLEKLTPAVATKLAKHQGQLAIDVTRDVPQSVIDAFDGHRGDLQVTTPFGSHFLVAEQIDRTPPDSDESGERASTPLRDNRSPRGGNAVVAGVGRSRLQRVPRDANSTNPRDDPGDDPGWLIQSMHRTMLAQHLRADTPVGKMIAAYQSGVPDWVESDGTRHSVDELGMPPIDWRSEPVVPACEGKTAKGEALVAVNKVDRGTSVTLAPVEFIDGLLCSITFLVIDRSHENARGLDYLAAQVELFGGDTLTLKTSPEIQADTFVDLWSAKKEERYTISAWKPNRPAGHVSARLYAPLLFQVLNEEPDFILLENLKIELSPRFKDGCRRLCDKVLELRAGQGQRHLPMCQKP